MKYSIRILPCMHNNNTIQHQQIINASNIDEALKEYKRTIRPLLAPGKYGLEVTDAKGNVEKPMWNVEK